jgi:hypothetical protein
MFLDTYFDEEDEREESIVNYAPVSASEDDGHMLQDPLLAGKAADKPILDPRSYFLEAFTIRIRRVNSEWRMVLQVLGDQIASAVSSFLYFLGPEEVVSRRLHTSRAPALR